MGGEYKVALKSKCEAEGGLGNRLNPFLRPENIWQKGNFHRGWIYNFILTWLIIHREVFVQEAACLIMVRLRLDWEQTLCQRLDVGWCHPHSGLAAQQKFSPQTPSHKTTWRDISSKSGRGNASLCSKVTRVCNIMTSAMITTARPLLLRADADPSPALPLQESQGLHVLPRLPACLRIIYISSQTFKGVAGRAGRKSRCRSRRDAWIFTCYL